MTKKARPQKESDVEQVAAYYLKKEDRKKE